MKQKLLKTMLLLSALVVVGLGNAWADTTVDVSISTYASTNSWVNTNAYPEVVIDANVTATGLNNGNNSKYYSSNNSWRHYEGDSGTITIEVGSGYVLKSITFTYASGNNGVLNYNSSNANSGTECDDVDGETSATFSVAHSSGTRNGNVQITNISVTYASTTAPGTCATPTFSPVAGTYNAAQSVSLNCKTADATIYYTTDGSDPTKSKSRLVYSDAISVTTTNTTIKAFASKDGLIDSEIASANYVLKCATPTFAPSDETKYHSAQEVEITSTEGATIYYTTDGNVPTTSSSVYNPAAKPTVSETTTIKALAVKSGWTDSDISTVNYEFAVTNTYNLTTSVVSGKHYVIANSITDGNGLAMSVQNANNRGSVEIEIDGESFSIDSDMGVCEVIIQGPDKDGFYTMYDIEGEKYLCSASSSNNYLRSITAIEAKSKWQITFNGKEAIMKAQDFSRNWIRNNGSIFSCYGSGQSAVYLYEKDGEATPTESVEVTSARYATYASDNALDFTGKSIEAYYATTKGDGTGVEFTRIYKVPAREGVLLHSASGATTLDIPVATTKDDVSDNVFKRGTGAAVATDGSTVWNYILNNVGGNIGFYKAAGQKVAKNRAYLSILKSESASIKEFIALPDFEEISRMMLLQFKIQNSKFKMKKLPSTTSPVSASARCRRVSIS